MGIGKTNAGGGGAALNFDVKRYATEEELLAAAPKENTIGIISTTEMTGWIIDANQPENLTEGMVWISVGTSSTVEFNALKKNGIKVYPLSAKQMVSGVLVYVEAMSYQDGEWKNFKLSLFPENGYSGQWVAKPYGSSAHAASDPTRATPTVSLSDNAMTVILDASGSQIYRMGSLFYDEPINFKNRNTITVKYSLSINQVSSTVSAGFVDMIVGKTMANSYGRFAVVSLPTGTDKTVELEVSGLDDVDGYIAFEIYAGYTKNTLTIKDFKVS